MYHVYTEVSLTGLKGASVMAFKYTGHTSYTVTCYVGSKFTTVYTNNEEQAIQVAINYVRS